MIAIHSSLPTSDRAVTDIDPDDLLVFLDETGDESLTDDSHPVFGLGGCAIRLALYDAALRDPWSDLRRHYFPTVLGAMHAHELKPSQRQLKGLSSFFRSWPFLRVAALVSRRSNSATQATALSACCDFVSAALQHFAVNGRTPKLVFVLERSQQRETATTRFLRQRAVLVPDHRSGQRVPVTVSVMAKADCEAGLEVADFIMHAAGGQVRSGSLDGARHRKDFQAVFSDVDQSWVRFALLG